MRANSRPSRPRRPGRIVAAAATVLLLAVSASAFALQPPSVDIGQGGLWIGLGYLRYQRPYIGTSRWTRLIPEFYIDTPHYFVHGLTYGWRAWHTGSNTFALIARPDALHYNGTTNTALAGMTTKLATVMGGAAWTWSFAPHLALDTQALADLLRRNDGVLVSTALVGRWRAGAWFFQPRLAVEWQSANYVDYYYGVDASEARPGRPAYSGSATHNETVGFDVGRTLGRHFTAMIGAYETRYGSGITGSPIVARSSALNLLFTLFYRF